jgi:hypothetical protein
MSRCGDRCHRRTDHGKFSDKHVTIRPLVLEFSDSASPPRSLAFAASRSSQRGDGTAGGWRDLDRAALLGRRATTHPCREASAVGWGWPVSRPQLDAASWRPKPDDAGYAILLRLLFGSSASSPEEER